MSTTANRTRGAVPVRAAAVAAALALLVTPVPASAGGPSRTALLTLTGATSLSQLADAVIALGDLDLWNFAACKGYPFTVTCQKLSGTFTPRVRLYGRNGALLSTLQSSGTVTLNHLGTNSGNYTVLVDGAGINDAGTYRITAYGIHENGLRLCPPIVGGGTMDLTGYGGSASATFVLLTTTDVTTPSALWTPVMTNQFDAFGGFDTTNVFNAGQVARLFRLRTP